MKLKKALLAAVANVPSVVHDAIIKRSVKKMKLKMSTGHHIIAQWLSRALAKKHQTIRSTSSMITAFQITT